MYDEVEMPLDYTNFTWRHADKGYYWDYKIKVDDLFHEGNYSSPFLIPKAEITSYIATIPFKGSPELFTLFAELPVGDNDESLKAITNFTNQYGLITAGLLMDTSYINDGISNYLNTFQGLSLDFYLTQIWQMKNTFRIWNWIQEKNSSMLSKVITWTNDNINYSFGEPEDLDIFNSTGIKYDYNSNCLTDLKGYIAPRSQQLFDMPNHKVFTDLVKDDYLFIAQLIVQKTINKKLDDFPVKHRLLLDKNKKLKQFFVPSDLLSCMWFQFLQVVTGERQLRQCAYCHKWENVTDKYASWKYHSRCGSNARVKKHRASK